MMAASTVVRSAPSRGLAAPPPPPPAARPPARRPASLSRPREVTVDACRDDGVASDSRGRAPAGDLIPRLADAITHPPAACRPTTTALATAAAIATTLLATAHPATAADVASAAVTPSFFAVSTSPATEPANALSLPTWAIHVSSVVEWLTAMGLFVKLGSVRGDPALAGMAWGMLPLLGGALAACTFHFFYNAPGLYPMVAAQAGLTVLGNATLALAAWRVWAAAREEEDAKKGGVRE